MTTVANIVRHNGFAHGERLGIIDGTRRLTWAEADRQSNQLAHVLVGRGLKKGDKVALLSTNSAFLYLFQFALAKIGVVFIPLNYRLRDTELVAILKPIDLAAMILGGDYETKGAAFLSELPQLAVMTLSDMEAESHNMPAMEPKVPLVTEADPYSIIFTSGSTGKPKGVIRSNRLSFRNAFNGALVRRFTVDDVSIVYTPNFHVSFWDSQSHVTTVVGGAVIIMDGFDPDEYIRWVTTERATGFFGVYTSLQKLMTSPGFDAADWSSFRRMQLPFKISDPERLKKIAAAFSVPLRDVYSGWGMSETGPLAINVHGEDWAAHPGTMGKPIPGIRLRIVDEAGHPVAVGEVGEIEVGRECVFDGYLNNPEENARAFKDGWFRSGDKAYLDKDNFVHFFSRAKDVIKRGGENISAVEVEEYLETAQQIAHAAVIAVPDAYWEETVMAFVQLAPGAKLTAEDVQAFARKGLATYKVPQHVAFVEALPWVSVGKVAKQVLRDQYLASQTPAKPSQADRMNVT